MKVSDTIKEYYEKKTAVDCPYCGEHVGDYQIKGRTLLTIWKCEQCKKDYLFNHTGNGILVSKLDWVVETYRISNLHKLPSEHQEAVQKAIKKLEENCYLEIHEPCNCGSHIRHNNGGNYHQIYEIRKDANDYYVKDDCTSELEPPAVWESRTKEEVYQLIQDCADWELYG